jgi:Ca-activated chloride channel family protein
MNIQANLDVDLVAIETTDRVTLMLDLTAPFGVGTKVRPGQAVQIVLDRSGSMGGEPLWAAKRSLLKLVDRLAPQDCFGIVAFDDQALVIVPTRLMADHNLPALRQVINQIDTGGSTDISAGYLMGLRELGHAKGVAGSTLVLISDGHANAGEQNPEVLKGIATKSAKKSVTTSTIGLGNGYDEVILEALAAGGGGHHRFASTIEEAIVAIAAEVDNLLEKSAINAILRVTPVPGLTGVPKIELLQQLPFWMDKDTYVVQLGDLHAGENRRFMIDIEVPGMPALGLCKVADITLEYLNVAEMSEINVSIPVNVNVVPDDIAKGRIADPVVRAERLVLEAQSEKALANQEIAQGKGQNAANRLKSSASRLRQEASLIPEGDERTSESLKIIHTEADEMLRLAEYAENEDQLYSMKRNTESMSRMMRSRKERPQNIEPGTIDPDQIK